MRFFVNNLASLVPGRLLVHGSESNPVVLKAAEQNNWNGLVFNNHGMGYFPILSIFHEIFSKLDDFLKNRRGIISKKGLCHFQVNQNHC